jgi:hypothetical protein
MYPAFRTTRSVLLLGAAIVFLLTLPMILSWIGPPSREATFSSVSDYAGAVGYEATVLYKDQADADVLFVGSSMVREGIAIDRLQKTLSERTGHPVHVVELVMNWPGVDSQYYMLRDYLQHHHAKLIVWNLPQEGASRNEPHRQAYRWLRYGQYSDSLSGLPPIYRTYLYGDMVLGAPRELLSYFRSDLIGDDERSIDAYYRFLNVDPKREVGFNGSTFIADSLPSVTLSQMVAPITSNEIQVKESPIGAYELHFLRKFVELAEQNDAPIVFIHMPEAREFGSATIPCIAPWDKMFGPNYKMIGAPSAVLFNNVSKERFRHFYVDDHHLNKNGKTWFTDQIASPVAEIYREVTSR